MKFEPVIGLEVHAELLTRSKMFCACPVVDVLTASPNTAVCPICAGMPGVLPVVNKQAVEYGLRVALALGCQIPTTSFFARKNYFYPDLPKGYQISQHEHPLAINGHLEIQTEEGIRSIRIREVHLEEDAGKLTHVRDGEKSASLVDLNRAGVPLLEIVSEPDLFSVEDIRLYTNTLRQLLRYLGVNSGDMEKGQIRFEANISLRPAGSSKLGTRVEIKNLNSFRSMMRAVNYEIERHTELLNQGKAIVQETLGWNETSEETFSQRGKEEAHDYRYFPEPDLPPVVIDNAWLEKVKKDLPEMPSAKRDRFMRQYGLNQYDAGVLTAELSVAKYFENTLAAAPDISPKIIANWISGEFFSLINQSNSNLADIEKTPVAPEALASLIQMVHRGEINKNIAKNVLGQMFNTGKSPKAIINEQCLQQISDENYIEDLVKQVLADNPKEVEAYLAGKETVARWLFGQIMRAAKGKANPQIIQSELYRQLELIKTAHKH